MKRFVIEKLIEWKASGALKPLVVNGARQVGKTWLLNEFARQCYKKQAYVVCRKNELLRQLFAADFDVERIVRGLCAITGVDIRPDDTLIVFDEVQEIPEIMESLKYFCEHSRRYHVAVAGSLLGVSLHRGVSFPVGKVEMVTVYPMSFGEFLEAIGEQEARRVLLSGDHDMTNALHSKYMELLRQYYYVGGMPEAVREYALTRSIVRVRQIQSAILRGYEQDFSKHVQPEQVARMRLVWHSVPSQLFKENKKFVYGVLRAGARARDYETAIEWLADAGLVYKVPRCSKPALPLPVYEDVSAFKLYMVDLGLLGAMAEVDAASVLVKDDALREYNGGFTEQYVLQQLICNGVGRICYHTADNSRLELDFVVQRDGRLVPIEVKAGGNVRANSLSAFLASHPEARAERYSMLPYKEQGQLTNIPLYCL